MVWIATVAERYIEDNKVFFLQKYYQTHQHGAVILFFNKDGSLYKEQFMTKLEIIKSSVLPDNAYSEAQEYWYKFPNQLVFLSWFYPITYGTPFSVYSLGTIMVGLPIRAISEAQKNDLLRKINQPPSQNINNSDCFIVTATFGTPDAKEVHRYRAFRDKYLMSNNLGLILVKIYYLIGPKIAKIIKSNLFLKKLSHKILKTISRILPV